MSSQAGTKMVPKLLEIIMPSSSRKLPQNFKLMEHLAKELRLLSIPTDMARNVSHVGGDRSYMILGSLARLEGALMKWSMNELLNKHSFTPVIVPNIIYDHIIERCGFPTKSKRSQVYKISGTNEGSILDENATVLSDNTGKSLPCIAGTSEFALASIHIGNSIAVEDLPKRYCALSRCYRAETSDVSLEWGIYRVHYFNKVEMFALTMPDKSSAMHDEFLEIEKDLFRQLGLQYQVLDMPEDDLGLSAKRKYDIEAWMPGRQRYGEISSTSNCEDYQSSRLDIKYTQMIESDNQLQIDTGFVHTVNGTACSSVRTLIAIFEQHQLDDQRVEIPKVLIPYMNGDKFIPTDQDLNQLKHLNLYSESSK